MSRRPRKLQEVKGTVGDAVSFAVSELQGLAEEIREVVDNASGTNRENTTRIQTLGETADTLEGIDEPTLEDGIGDLEVVYHVMMARSKRIGLSRGDRRDNAVQALDAVIQFLQELQEKEDEKKKDDEEDTYRSLIDDLERIKDDSESVEFPGMYG